MIKAVFFDLDGTLRLNEPRGGEVFAEYASTQGLRVRPDDVLRAARWEHFYWANSPDLLADRRRFDGQEDGFWTNYSHRQLVALGASNQQALELTDRMSQHMRESYKPRSVVPAGLLDLLRSLQSAGYVLGVISNRSEPYQQELEDLGLASCFSYSLAAGEIESWKPSPGIFLHACRQLAVQPEQSIYVGDNYFADVVGARSAGLTPVLYDPRGIFDDPECAVIQSFTDLLSLLKLKVHMAPSVDQFPSGKPF